MRFFNVGALCALAVGVVAQAPVPYVLRLMSHATLYKWSVTNVEITVLRCRTLF
jgi:hypothetical protein